MVEPTAVEPTAVEPTVELWVASLEEVDEEEAVDLGQQARLPGPAARAAAATTTTSPTSTVLRERKVALAGPVPRPDAPGGQPPQNANQLRHKQSNLFLL
jgi:hypothetical protein